MQVTRPISLVRKLIPFKFDCCGPVAEVARQVFDRHPHIFPDMLRTLEQTDTAAEPRILFADALQQLMDPSVKQNTLREAFEEAELHCRREFFMSHYDPRRCGFDFNYRLDTLQLVGASAYWARMMRIHSQPCDDALNQLAHLYTADARRDPTMKGFVEYLTHEHERNDVAKNPHKQRFIENCFLLERDIFGPYRLDEFSNRKFVFHAITLDEISKSEETFRMLTDIEAVKKFGHFELTVQPEQTGVKRWRVVEVRCRPEEEESIPWSDEVFNEKIGRKIEILFDEPLVGRPPTVDKRIRIDGTLYPKTTMVTIEYAVEEEDETFMGRLWRRRYTAIRELQPEKWFSSSTGPK